MGSFLDLRDGLCVEGKLKNSLPKKKKQMNGPETNKFLV